MHSSPFGSAIVAGAVLLGVATVYVLAWSKYYRPSPGPAAPVEKIADELRETNVRLGEIAYSVARIADRGPVQKPPPGDTCAEVGYSVVVPFAFDSSDIQEAGERLLEAFIERVGAAPSERDYVLIEGYATAVGVASYNLDLSERRAKAVEEFLPIAWQQGAIVVSRGERHDEAIPGKDDVANQRVRLVLCSSG